MVGVIIAGHGNFASGIESVIKLIVGEQENIRIVDFLEQHSTEDLKRNILENINELNCNSYLIFTDIPGGSPFKASVEVSMDNENIEVISGTNVPMIMEILFDRDNEEVEKLKQRAIETGKKQILSFELKESKKEKEIKIEDGI
ncbi:PTS sugar transporter subunit IIA [Clostridium sp. D2Q-11]|uniref:PTS sugar transporter subunit IIA n=1 Tax=Anaeromonas frigoriresistens TaxID=2683708 RepID=A0A942US10_9FIRM|nr:PTS galactosamine/N-acetylgalactosamine transporter subunit IIA [Anaeromonas frigoriresistens]MBS4538113.1 PTS sugar transporter subunit IIA [Anaeromonas frigoriresistens]